MTSEPLLAVTGTLIADLEVSTDINPLVHQLARRARNVSLCSSPWSGVSCPVLESGWIEPAHEDSSCPRSIWTESSRGRGLAVRSFVCSALLGRLLGQSWRSTMCGSSRRSEAPRRTCAPHEVWLVRWSGCETPRMCLAKSTTTGYAGCVPCSETFVPNFNGPYLGAI